MKSSTRNKPAIPNELRLGCIASLYYKEVREVPVPKQIEVLDAFFKGFIVKEIPSDGQTKKNAVYNDMDGYIEAVRYQGSFHTGQSKRVTQIIGRLIGTAKKGIEKERKTASLIQEKIAGDLANNEDRLNDLRCGVLDLFKGFSETEWERFFLTFADYINAVTARREAISSRDKELELFPMDDEIFYDLMEGVINEWNINTLESKLNSFTWLLLGALLRNRISRLTYVYDSGFRPRRSQPASLRENEDFDYYYEGDDLDKRFPGIEWYCDRCGEHLNEQEGFDDHHHIWKCTNCGYKNEIEIRNIYDPEDSEVNAGQPTIPDKFFKALKERTDELDAQENIGDSSRRRI